MFSANLIAQSAADVWHIEINPESDRLLDGEEIGKLLADKWILLEPGWKVTPSGGPAVLVQHGDSEGVLVSLHGEVDRYRRFGLGTRQPSRVYD
jgi:hypothetical protein